MKPPQQPPTNGDLWSSFELGPELFTRVMTEVTSPLVKGRYVHWDKLRRMPPPDGLTHRAWWWGLKMQRQFGRKEVGLSDTAGNPFWYTLADPLPERLHHADSGARGSIGVTEATPNKEIRNQYLVRSLMEESITSSLLEGASATREVAKKMIREGRPPRDRSERMIFNNYRTMERIRQIADQDLSADLVCEIQRIVTESTLDHRGGARRFRREDEPIVIGDEFGEVFHTPPPARTLAERMNRMCDFANARASNEFVHPMIRSMILHFWLAYDHPFVDGNGRTARALFYWSMLRHEYWLFEFVSISRIILRSPVQYGRAFLHTESDGNDLTYFLLFHAEVIRKAVDELHVYLDEKSKRVRQAEAELRGIQGLNPRQQSLVIHALRHPGEFYTIEGHRSSHATVSQTARTDLLGLVDRGLFRKEKIGRVGHFRAVADLENRLG